jgi:hypothetical protein
MSGIFFLFMHPRPFLIFTTLALYVVQTAEKEEETREEKRERERQKRGFWHHWTLETEWKEMRKLR